MSKKRVTDTDRIKAFQTYLPSYQVDWIKAHPDLLIHEFIRDKIKQYIEDAQALKVEA